MLKKWSWMFAAMSVISTSVWASEGLKFEGGIAAAMTQLADSKTPYQILEAAFEQGRPTRLREIPTFDDCRSGKRAYKTINSVNSSTTMDQVQVANEGYLYLFPKLTEKAGFEKAGAGPLFPSVPAQDVVVKDVVSLFSSCRYPFDDSTLSDATRYQLKVHYSVSETNDGLLVHRAGDDWTSDILFRSLDGEILVKIVYTHVKDGKRETEVSYSYAWMDSQ